MAWRRRQSAWRGAGRPKSGLAGSGGGYVRQLLDLEPAWAEHDYFFLTEDTALSRSIAEKHRTLYVPHFCAWAGAVGCAAEDGPFRRTQLLPVGGHYPAGAPQGPDQHRRWSRLFRLKLGARLIGAKVVVIESFAFMDNRPSSAA